MKKSNVPFEMAASVATIAIQLATFHDDNYEPRHYLEEAIALIEEAREKIQSPKEDDIQ
jgi:hypothetical protein